jgi:hypothetical protein
MAGIHLNTSKIEKFIPYRPENTLRVYYIDQPVNGG